MIELLINLFKGLDLHSGLACVSYSAPNNLVTSIHENWFSARCVNTSKPAGEGAIVLQTAVFLLVALYDGSVGAASRAIVAIDQFAWQLGRRNL
ncbi:hypothetical protein JCGZ_19471 [Jatropha curcas]|uniref:Uncharacterized protein n=1 Tax=Jatropha curcas TaxID=180498 RepID=A0A067JZ17_JATCU|nr:hypothetical protein JCGZ_19471 [Jatropha curcas]